MAGMTTAAIVTGNTVVLKPSSDSPAVAAFFMSILREADTFGWCHFVTGAGKSVGNALVDLAFSRIEGSGTAHHGGSVASQARHTCIKRVIAEMGETRISLLSTTMPTSDSAADGVLASAFGYQGQKCLRVPERSFTKESTPALSIN